MPPSETRPASWGPLLVVAAVVLVGGAGLAFSVLSEPALPEYGPIPAFSLEERSGGTIALNDLLGKVWVADFIFTNCAGVCPAMTHCMAKVQDAMKDDPDARLVSITTDPGRDTIEVLRAYADRHGASKERWFFLRGPQADVLALQVKGFKMGSPTDPFLHSERLVLVDKRGRIRGWYHGTEDAGVEALLKDYRRLRRAGGA
jgi:protein SCO1/2